ncbi:MAG TPA: hypothetical protein VN380_06810 [Thermoanaerobaculia bacterium]|jgi:hypothetical protein|nr:hypothetical protein [Thermoanaerobaculia bacterium]
MDLVEFLTLRDAGLPSVIEKVHESIGLRDDDVLLAVGSLVEGLGNSKSDVDLLLITRREIGAHPATLVVDRCLVDLRVLHARDVEELLLRFDAWSRLEWAVTHAVKFTLDERTLLHRILNGYPLYNGRRNRVMKRLPQPRDLARLKLHVARQASRTIQVDMAGYRETGDYRSMVFAAQEVAGHAVDALAAGYELTNPLIKWRSRMLDAVPDDWEGSLMTRPTGLKAGEFIWRLHRAPEWPDRASTSKHALRITTFARAVFLSAEFRLLGAPAALKEAFRRFPRGKMRSTARDSEAALPYLDFDVDFVLSETGAALGRLNEFGEPIELPPCEFAVALFFDGITTARDAATRVYGSSAKKVLKNVDNVLSRITEAGFTVPCTAHE